MVKARLPDETPRQPYEKVAITLPSRLLDLARREAEASQSRSLSAFIARALEEKLERDELQHVLDETFAEQPLTDDERARPDSFLH